MTQNLREFIFLMKHLKGVGNTGLLRLLHAFMGESNIVWDAGLLAQRAGVKPKYQEVFQQSVEFIKDRQSALLESCPTYPMVTILDDAYPDSLREIYDPPIALFYAGDVTLLKTTCLAMVGSRAATSYGRRVIESLMPQLAAQPYTIVSGLAKGIDTYSHQTAIRYGGKTIAVIGSGLDVSYPQENFRLQQYMSDHCLVVSEYLPAARPLAWHFPQRNRIIAGLSWGTCVIEARAKSGSIITAQLALESGREVFAVPGNGLTTQSDGCLQLIQEGAKCVWKAEHIIAELPVYKKINP